MANVDVDVDVYDFLSSCYDTEIKEVIEWLSENDKLIDGELTDGIDPIHKHIKKISQSTIQLTTEEELIIEGIYKRLV